MGRYHDITPAEMNPEQRRGRCFAIKDPTGFLRAPLWPLPAVLLPVAGDGG
jgi:hypothetical protein